MPMGAKPMGAETLSGVGFSEGECGEDVGCAGGMGGWGWGGEGEISSREEYIRPKIVVDVVRVLVSTSWRGMMRCRKKACRFARCV